MPIKKKAPARKTPTKTRSKKSLPLTSRKAATVSKKTKISLNPVPSKRKNLHLGIHLVIAGSAIAVLLLLGVVERNIFATRGSNAEVLPATIGLEYDSPLSLSVLVARKGEAGYASIFNESTETIYVSTPSDWSRTEVTGANLSDVKQEIPVFGFTRWTLPGKAGIKLVMPQAPGAIFFDSQSHTTAAVDLKSIDLATSFTSGKVILIQDQALVQLWKQEE